MQIIKILYEVFFLLKSFARDLFILIKLEAELARRSLIRICVLSVIALILVTTLWVSLMFLLILWLSSFGSWFIAFLSIVGLNLLLLLGICFIVWRLTHSLMFENSRKQIAFFINQKGEL